VQLGRIVGTVVSTAKDPKLEGLRFHVVRNVDLGLKEKETFLVAVDSVGAGVGETVLYATGSSARQTDVTKDRPCDAVIMAIVDSIDVAGKQIFDKTKEG